MFKHFIRQLAFEYQFSGRPAANPERFRKKGSKPVAFHSFEMRTGRGGRFGFGGGPSRFFGRGDVKFALLELLQERPMHGYEMMKALEEKSGGVYIPSAGTIYPTLQLLEDRGFVTVGEAEGKKVYHITEAGQTALKERFQAEADYPELEPGEAKGFGRGWHKHEHSPEMRALKSEFKETVQLLLLAGRIAMHDAAQRERLRGIIKQLQHDLAELVYSEKPTGRPENPE